MWSILYYLRNEPGVLKRNMQVRGLTFSVVDEAIYLDDEVRRLQRELDELRYKRNQITRSKLASKRYISVYPL